MGQTSADLKSKGTSDAVKDLLKIWQRCMTTPSATALSFFGKKPLEPSTVTGFSSFNFDSALGSLQSMDNNRIGYMLSKWSTVKTTLK